LAIGGLNGFVSTEVQNSTSVLRLKFSAKNPAHRQYAARYATPYLNSRAKNKKTKNKPTAHLAHLVLLNTQANASQNQKS
jgi:hypothetical protein